MPIVINHSVPLFWTPINANARAATLESDINGKTVSLNFYWSGVAHDRVGKNSEIMFKEQITNFLKTYKPKESEKLIRHFQYDGDSFRKILDPHFIQGQGIVK